ncbi:unnamed protein product [Musa textilis]
MVSELESLLQTQPDITEAAVVPPFLLRLGNMSTNSISYGFFDRYPDEEAGQVPVAFVARQTHSTWKESSQVMEFVSNKVSNLVHQNTSCFLCGVETNECCR